MTADLLDAIPDILQTRSSAAGLDWLATARKAAGGLSLEPLLTAYTSATVRFGRAPLALTPAEQATLSAAACGVTGVRWTEDDAARVVLLAERRRGGRTGQEFVADAVACFDQGDAREQQSWLRAVAMFPEAPDFLPVVIDACRTNIIPVFEAVACENPYAARYFPELNFNQMILKALFNGIALSRVVALDTRLNGELRRMALDYAAERRAAGRAVPADIDLVTGAVPAAEQHP